MIYACAEIGSERVEAYPRGRAFCPVCNSPAIAKCGAVNVWHWAHENRADCDTWSEPETVWHRDWKSLVPLEQREVVIGRHRADMVTADGLVVELQHSHISSGDISARQRFYKRMIWIFDATGQAHPKPDQRYSLPTYRFEWKKSEGYYTFKWRTPRRTLCNVTGIPVFLDLGDGLVFEVRKLYSNPYGGWGHLHFKDSFIHRFIDAKHPCSVESLPDHPGRFYSAEEKQIFKNFSELYPG